MIRAAALKKNGMATRESSLWPLEVYIYPSAWNLEKLSLGLYSPCQLSSARPHRWDAAGARALVQAERQISLEEYAKDHKELDTALKYWGYWGGA